MTTVIIFLSIVFLSFWIPLTISYHKSRSRWKRLGFMLIMFLTLNTASAQDFVYDKEYNSNLTTQESKFVKKWCSEHNVAFPLYEDTTLTSDEKFEVYKQAVNYVAKKNNKVKEYEYKPKPSEYAILMSTISYHNNMANLYTSRSYFHYTR